MKATYNQIAGQSVERIAALSDGIFAVAMTLLVLDLKVPLAESVHTEHDLRGALLALAPRLLMFAMSVLTLGIFWGRTTNAAEQSGTFRPKPLLDSHRLPRRSIPYSLFHRSSRRVHPLSHCARNLLAQHPSPRCHPSPELDLCGRKTAAESQPRLRSPLRRSEPHSDCPSPLRLRRATLRFQHLLEYRPHRRRSAELCCCSAPATTEEMNRTLPSRSFRRSILGLLTYATGAQ